MTPLVFVLKSYISISGLAPVIFVTKICNYEAIFQNWLQLVFWYKYLCYLDLTSFAVGPWTSKHLLRKNVGAFSGVYPYTYISLIFLQLN